MARHVDGNDDEAAEGDGSDSESDGDGDMYDLGGETGGQVKKKKNQAPVAMARGGDDNDDDDDENMYDLGGETGGQIAQPRIVDEDEPLFSFVAINDEAEGDDAEEDIGSTIAQPELPTLPVTSIEAAIASAAMAEFSSLAAASRQTIPEDASIYEYDFVPKRVADESSGPMYLVPQPLLGSDQVCKQLLP